MLRINDLHSIYENDFEQMILHFFFQFGRPLFTTSGFAIQNDNLEVGFHVGVVSYYIPIHGLSYPIN